MTNNTDTVTDSVDSGALVLDGPQPVWMTLNAAREQAFTGEIVFEADPEVLAYLDNGIVYFAERADDASLGQRLLDEGVVDATQLERGLVRIGDLEHLGRLFDRDPSIDRDAVVVTAELFTEELISGLANQTIANARVAAYRHHPSGVHRWFVAPIDQATITRPIGVVGQLDGTVIDDLPGLPYGLEEDELMIEWDVIADFEFDPQTLDDTEVPDAEQIEIVDTAELDKVALELSLELAEFVDHAVEAEPQSDADADADAGTGTDIAVDAADDDDFEFSVVWPDGSEHLTNGAGVHIDEPIVDEPTFTQTDDGDLQFTMPPLTLSDEPEAADAEVPDDVADAVRRAIAAIETASVGAPDIESDGAAVLPEMTDVEVVDFDFDLDLDLEPAVEVVVAEVAEVEVAEVEVLDDDVVDIEFSDLQLDLDTVDAAPDAIDHLTAPTNGFAGFAPPTMATRAEVLYGQMSDDGALIDTPEEAAMPTLAPQTLATSAADAPSEHGGERASALHRLIGSLRRKDH